MSDNIDVDPGTGASKQPVATDDVGGAHYQRVKLDVGGDGLSVPVTDAAPLPVNVSQIGGSAARTANLDTGGGTDTYPVFGLVYQASGGAMQVEQTAGGAFPVRILNTPSAQVFTVDADTTATEFDPVCTVGFVRDDALTTLANLDGKYTQGRVDSTGALWTRVSTALPAGTNNIGDVDVLTQPARAATTDNIGAKLATDAIMNGTTALTPKFAIIDAATSGDNTLVASVSGKKIRVLAAFLVAAGAVNARFESGAGGTALTGQMNLTTNSGFTLPFNPVGWFETAATTLLNLELSGAVSVDGCLTYVEV